MEKYSKPSLPTPKCVVEDLTALHIVRLKEHSKLIASDETLQDTFKIYLNCKQLQNDIIEQQELNNTLEELNKQLMGNIESMKKQQIVDE